MSAGPSLCGETCPNEHFCQQCATEDIKSLCVDFLEMKEYHEIDLDQEPCIFPDCGHFLTTSSMDGQMEMAAYYDVDMDGHPIRLGKASESFSLDNSGIPVCATCRGPLRSIARYGRIVRRAMLDESTKKFIEWSHGQYLSLANRLLKEQEKLGQQQTAKAGSYAAKEGKLTHHAQGLDNFESWKGSRTTAGTAPLLIYGGGLVHMQAMLDGKNSRFSE